MSHAVIPDMQPITLRIPRAFIASTMFLVPSDIMVVGPNEQKQYFFNNEREKKLQKHILLQF